jgi:hypothetical protein
MRDCPIDEHDAFASLQCTICSERFLGLVVTIDLLALPLLATTYVLPEGNQAHR